MMLWMMIVLRGTESKVRSQSNKVRSLSTSCSNIFSSTISLTTLGIQSLTGQGQARRAGVPSPSSFPFTLRNLPHTPQSLPISPVDTAARLGRLRHNFFYNSNFRSFIPISITIVPQPPTPSYFCPDASST